ncbi:expressed unknown protein [Seminavis robusta]|uniref:Uncharacterized protein n=1 Tax=Seminavis robusta TaxID=568900 RepID=A0A9N8DJI1_9STRA|nr:expressed unknown protein [Seminavis robusta]|eukprot:Sro120_g058630.1 n/a (502) ;mRNA; f:87756-89351
MDASDWIKGIFFSVMASFIGAASKLAIRKSWLIEEDAQQASSYQGPILEYINPSNDQTGSSVDDGLIIGNNPNEALLRGSEDEDIGPCLECPERHTRVSTREGDDTIPLLGESTPLLSRTNCRKCCCCTRSMFGCCYCCSLARFLRFCGMMGMTFVNPAFSLLAMKYATPSILAPFSGLTLVWVIVFSQPLVGEVPSLEQKIASALIVMGEVTVAVFGDHTNEDDATCASVKASYGEGPFVAYFLGLAVYMALITIWIRNCPAMPTLRQFAWGTSGGALTGLAQCFIKDSLVIVSACKGSSSSTLWILPFFIFLAIASSFGGLLFLTATMKRYDATYSAAMFVGSFVVSTSLMSLAHYHTFDHLGGIVDLVMYPMGLFILMLGVSILIHCSGSSVPNRDYPGDINDPSREPLTQRDHLAAGDVDQPFFYEEPETDDEPSTEAADNQVGTEDLELVSRVDEWPGLDLTRQRFTSSTTSQSSQLTNTPSGSQFPLRQNRNLGF